MYNFVETFDDLLPHLDFKDDMTTTDKALLIQAFESAPEPYRNQTFEFVLQDFLQATGIPVPNLFASIQDRINPVVSLEEALDSPTFRLRSFTWAVGGAPFLRVGNEMNLEVGILYTHIHNRSESNL